MIYLLTPPLGYRVTQSSIIYSLQTEVKLRNILERLKIYVIFYQLRFDLTQSIFNSIVVVIIIHFIYSFNINMTRIWPAPYFILDMFSIVSKRVMQMIYLIRYSYQSVNM